MNFLFALLAGIGFGMGLTISGMVDPQKVLGFLDVAGDWDASLAFVMGGALMVFIPGFQIVKKQLTSPLFEKSFFLPSANSIDKPLVIGAVLFGIGWGLSGICPGPAIANISGMEDKVFGFILAMLIGMIVARRINAK
ncbi:YeeE/YedE family protein [Alteromonas sediminis]|uniref:YeeE/YedE family protein n=1 Tax=Alteromonas sediminis TaxID=2259342 RepID=A0A3N5Y9X5_9ALTE|nr:YeeE/YedE family protein [Alteromonas sediminis]RPJ68179.1 YeeE/YedE family protein [Alteromonas sediminis]